jgi:hypothetical protein
MSRNDLLAYNGLIEFNLDRRYGPWKNVWLLFGQEKLIGP